DAHAHHDDALADFYRARFRDEFKPAFAAWLATKPLTSPQAPPTPFAMPRYRLRSAVEVDRLEQTAAADSQHAKAANENADNYMLAVVLFASSLFFAGISVKLHSVRARASLLVLGCFRFLATFVWALPLPV